MPDPTPDTAPQVDPQQVLADPKFLKLTAQGQLEVMRQIDPRFKALSEQGQYEVLRQATSRALTQPKGPSLLRKAWDRFNEPVKMEEVEKIPGLSPELSESLR